VCVVSCLTPASSRRYDLALDAAEFRVTREEETMYGIQEVKHGSDYGMGDDPNHALTFAKVCVVSWHVNNAAQHNTRVAASIGLTR